MGRTGRTGLCSPFGPLFHFLWDIMGPHSVRTITCAGGHVALSPEVIDHHTVIFDLSGAPLHVAVNIRASAVVLPLHEVARNKIL